MLILRNPTDALVGIVVPRTPSSNPKATGVGRESRLTSAIPVPAVATFRKSRRSITMEPSVLSVAATIEPQNT
jgi:hypothetical protein